MSPDIVNEMTFLLHSVLAGIIISFFYDLIITLRKIIKHSFAMISIQDVLFWAICAFCFFVLLGKENDGILRWFSVAGFGVGMYVYHISVGKYFSDIMSTFIIKCIHIILYILHIVCMPIKWVIGLIAGLFGRLLLGLKKFYLYLKKQLTVTIKLLNIILCKHIKKKGSLQNGKVFHKKTKTE